MSPEILEALYASVEANEIKMNDSDMVESEVVTFMAPARSGWLSKQGAGAFGGWKKHWFVLADSCLYYFAKQGDKDPRCIIPLDNCGVNKMKTSDTTFSIFSRGAAHIKSVKVMPNGVMEQGEHKQFMLRAPSAEERDMWVRSLSDDAAAGADPAERFQTELAQKREAAATRSAVLEAHRAEPAMASWMFKTPKGKPGKWKRRFCTLHLSTPARIYYFKSENDAKLMQTSGAWKAKGFVELGGVKAVAVDATIKGPGGKTFMVETQTRTWPFSTERAEAADTWVTKVRSAPRVPSALLSQLPPHPAARRRKTLTLPVRCAHPCRSKP